MPYYETVFIVRQDMSPTQVETMADSYAEFLGQYEGSVVKREMWGLRTLTYRINKNRKGHYVMMHLDTPPAGLNEMERQMRLSEDVLRYMTVKIDDIPEGPSAMLQQRERGDRGDRGGRDHSHRRESHAASAEDEPAAATEGAE